MSTCRSEKPQNGELIERTCDCVVASRSRTWKWWKTSSQDRTRRLRLFWKEKEIQELRELKMPNVLPGYSVGKLSEAKKRKKRQRKATGGEERDECDGGQRAEEDECC